MCDHKRFATLGTQTNINGQIIYVKKVNKHFDQKQKCFHIIYATFIAAMFIYISCTVTFKISKKKRYRAGLKCVDGEDFFTFFTGFAIFDLPPRG